MCGIAGFYQPDFNYNNNPLYLERIENMRDSIKHRGPDDDGLFMNPHVYFAHTRLSIIDLDSGHQPMTSKYYGKTATITYNGEIYNFIELKKELIEKGMTFSTSSDTEVILNGYLLYGEDFFKKLNGIFAFAIYDHRDDSIIIVRDHLGVKPLFFAKMASSFIFASEPKALFAYGLLPRLNDDSFKMIFGVGPAVPEGKTPYCGIEELIPGTFLKVAPKNSGTGYKILSHYYWKLDADIIDDDYDTAIEKTGQLVENSIKRQMISDIPICTFLSGGLDSSLVSSVCANELSKNTNISSEDNRLLTFSFDFKDNDKNFIANDFQNTLDGPFVDIMKSYINSNHNYLEAQNEVMADYLKKAVDAHDIPCMADVESSLLYFCSLVVKKSKVALTGECADEIFGGYPWFHKEELMNTDDFPWSLDFPARTAFLCDNIVEKLDLKNYSKELFKNTMAAAPVSNYSEADNSLQRLTYLNIKWFMATLLSRMDRTSMFWGLEARVPFADYKILEYTYNLPRKYKFHSNKPKELLIESTRRRNLLPESILNRKKNPYPKTYDKKYESLLISQLNEILSDRNSPLYDFIDTDKVNKYLSSIKDYGKPWYGQLMAGPQLIGYYIQLDYWLRKCYY